VSSHGVILKTDQNRQSFHESGDQEVETYEDYILTHPEREKTSFSPDFEEERVTVREIVEIFRDAKLKGIPKIFFIQVIQVTYAGDKKSKLSKFLIYR
jgi:hypothetical protein